MTLVPRREAAEARRILRERHNVKSLLGAPADNPKLAKSLKMRVYSAPLHLAPASLSGFNVCPMSTAGCRKACLHTAGNPAYMVGKAKARVARTEAYFGSRAAFMVALAADIEAHAARAKANRMRCGVRLNATSDIPWENVPVTVSGRTYPNLMALFPRVQFYDYTKRHNRRDLPSNYHLTFSLAEAKWNWPNAFRAFAYGMNVAAVFSVPRGKPLPATFRLEASPGHPFDWVDVPVIDGDEHDYRPADPRGVIVGLRAKGKACQDKSGFVQQVEVK